MPKNNKQPPSVPVETNIIGQPIQNNKNNKNNQNLNQGTNVKPDIHSRNNGSSGRPLPSVSKDPVMSRSRRNMEPSIHSQSNRSSVRPVPSVENDPVMSRSRENMESDMHSQNNGSSIGPVPSSHMATPSKSQVHPYESVTFPLNSSIDPEIHNLFNYLRSLPPMDKYGPMSGNCDRETTQMENFLSETFGFQNLPGKYIVHGVKAFQLRRPIDSMSPNSLVRFPSKTIPPEESFQMSVDEIRQWQNSYAVYADQTQKGMTKEFLKLALQGQSEYGAEAFLMKFVVRISQCPILMEFDGKIIRRNYNESWPNNIRLVSVTGIDFAGRIHDVDDIRTYVVNWRDVYELDRKRDLPVVYNGRDFYLKPNPPRGQLNKGRLLDDLKRMARLRLQACDREKVQIVVETGIGLGVFAGKYIGIDEKVREYSAYAIRQVLEEDGPNYRNILAVVFALPIFEKVTQNNRREDTFEAFRSVFHVTNYNGPIPVLIADQDMHRLTVAIARKNFKVSELNPADSHGVFGEYWQNRGPAVEEKLALTTVGLLVQHHFINPYVLDPSHYHLIYS